MEVHLQPLITLELERRDWSASCHRVSISKKGTPSPIEQEAGWAPQLLWMLGEQKSLVPQLGPQSQFVSCPALSLLLNAHVPARGPGSSVGIATDYRLDGPGSNPGRDEIFRPSRPALGPTQPPVQWVPGLSRG